MSHRIRPIAAGEDAAVDWQTSYNSWYFAPL